MINKTKTGFSLAEVLISIGIVSVIATLGFSLTRKNIDNAYKKYVFTGANALSEAIFDAETQGKANNIENLTEHLKDLFSDNTGIENNNYKITANNGIVFEIEDLGTASNKHIYEIEMTTPGKRTSGDNSNSYKFIHYPEEEYPTLFVLDDTANRIDLLKYYIAGENNNSSFYSFREAACHNLRESITITLDDESTEDLLNCEGIEPENIEGTIVMIRP